MTAAAGNAYAPVGSPAGQEYPAESTQPEAVPVVDGAGQHASVVSMEQVSGEEEKQLDHEETEEYGLYSFNKIHIFKVFF